ncbi:MAG: Gfo/Idh/MocA family oxidoreductase [Chloroflexi bacterium]|nr:Gfo/Idh/MocA family oxidoreductase [Chloroflexota bacterium]
MTSPVRIGVIGCGAIAQVQHLPFLTELAEEFEVAAVCDVSSSAVEYAAKRFHVPNRLTDYREMLDSDIDAVLMCHYDPKTEVAVASLEAGKHVFVEKPVCYSNEEFAEIAEAARRSSKVAQAGYMKLYEPAYEMAKPEIEAMDDVRFVQINHLHPNNDLHVAQFRTRSFDDVPPDVIEKTRAARQHAVRQAIGDAPPEAIRAFGTISGSMIHDLYGLRDLFGMPSRVVSTEIWQDGGAISTTLEYPRGFRCVATWVDLPDLWDFYETLEVYGSRKRVIISYPTGFSREVAQVKIHEIDEHGTTMAKEPALDWESPFRRELRHFHDCIVDGQTPRSPLTDAGHDVALVIDIVKAYLDRGR